MGRSINGYLEMKRSTALKSQAEAQPLMAINPVAFTSKVTAAIFLLKSSQQRAGWRLLHEAMDMIRPMLASKSPYVLETLIQAAWMWETLLPPDFYGAIWGQISKMASIALGESNPLSKACLAITHIKSKKNLVYDISVRLIRSIFERTLGPYNHVTLLAKSNHVVSLLVMGDLAGAECLQRIVISDFKKLGDKCIWRKEVAYELYRLGYILKSKGNFTEAKKVLRDALHLGRVASWERFPKQLDYYCISNLVPMLAEDEYNEGEILLQEALEKCLEYEHWGRCDWHTVFVSGLLEDHFKKQKKFHEAEMLRLQYPGAF